MLLQDLGSDHIPILLSIPLSPVYRPNERTPSFNFQKARWDGFASYFDSHYSSAEEYSSLFLFSAAALFLFLLARAAPAFLPIALSVALRPLFPFRQAQYAQVFPLKPAPFCTLYAGLGSTNKSAISLLFSSAQTLTLYLLLCPLLRVFCYFNLPGRSGRNFLFSPPVLTGYNGCPDTRFFRERRADELARRGALLAPSAILCSLSPLISRIHSYLFWDWRRTVLSKYFGTQVPSISTDELVLPRHARCVLSSLCNGHSLLLGSYLSKIGRIKNPSCSACGHSSQDISHLILHYPATDSVRRSLFTISGPGLGELPGFLGSMVSRHAPISRKGSGNQQQQQAHKNGSR